MAQATKDKTTQSARERILETAGKLFYSQGYLATGINQIIAEAGQESIEKLRHLKGVVRGQTHGKDPDSHLARQLSDLAKVIKAGEGLEVAAIDYNGWDHHAYQGGNEGTMANMLTTAGWNFGEDAQPHIDYIRSYYDTLEPFTGGFYINDTPMEADGAMINANEREHHGRLVEIKNKYDPTNLFRLNANVRPTV